MIRAASQLRAAILFTLAVGPLFGASSINWTTPFPATNPPARSDSAMVYDSTRHQVVLFGGYTSAAINDTWLWDGTNWTQASPATSPPARAGHAMAYDSVRRQVVLFGGYDNSFNDLSDTWVWDGVTWTRQLPATSPSAREFHSMMFDAARSQVVLFGGEVSNTDSSETWTWDGTTWTQRAIGNGPSSRAQAGFVYDSTHSIGVLFGGRQGFEIGLGDTWIWGGTSWSQRAPAASPSARGNSGMVYDSARGLVVLFGGEDFSSEGSSLGDTWYYDDTTWTQATTQASPSARIGPAMAYDSLNAQSVLFSGQNANNTTWLLSALTVLPKSLPDATQGTNYNVQYSADGGTPGYSFSVTGLPPGLSVTSGNQIVGQCTGQSATGVTISVTDRASPPSTASVGPLPLHCNPAPVITNTSPLPAGTTGVAYSVQFTTNAVYDAPGAAPYTWTLTPGTLPSGFALDATGILTGTTSTAQTSNFSVRFTDRWGATTLKAFQLSFYAPLSVTNSSLPSGTAGSAYTATTLTASGGSGGYVFSVSGLPAGLAVTGSPQAITGTPTQTGTFNPIITVSDSASETAQRTLSLTIAASAAISITTASALPAGRSGQAYSTTIAWTGGVAPYTVTGSGLPSWLTVNNAGLLSGTPPAGGSFTFSITVHDTQSPTQNTATKSFTINVTAPVITTTSPLPSATIGVFYSDTFASSGGVSPYSYLASGLPGWLSMSSGGVLSGTPPTGTVSPVTFSVQVRDSANSTSSGNFSLPIITPASLMFVTTSPLPTATVGTAYSTNFAVSGGVSPYTYAASGLPSWLTLSTGGTLSGTPPSPANATFQVTATDSASNTVTSSFTLPVNAVLTIGTTSPLPAATMGVAYTQTLSASGGSGGYVWGGTGLPAWLSISSSGVLSGTPPTATSVSFSVNVTDSSSGTVSKTFSLPVNSALTIGSASPLPAATLNAPYMFTFTASGGGGGYSWSGSGLPSGFSVSSGGVLTGTPVSTAALSFTINVLDSLNNTVSKAFSLPVNGSVTITNTSPLAPATVSVAYTANFTASGGSGGYSWSATGLPAWLTLTSAGFLSGTPPSAGNVSFMVTVTDSQSHTATGNFTLPVNSVLSIDTTSPLSPSTAGAAYSLQLAASGGSGSYSWASTMLPSWLTLTSGGLLSGTPPAAATVNFTATVTDTLSNTASRSFTLPVNSAVTISTASPLSAATLGVAYTAQFAASGGTNSYNWSASSLPAWLSLSSGGLLSGTPPAPGTVTFTATATDSQSHSATGTFMLPVNASLTIGTTSPLARAVVGTAYSLQFTASGGAAPYQWAGASLPQWLTITSGGLLTGTPPSAASATFGVTVTDSLRNTATGTFTLPVDPALALTSTSPLPAATTGASYSFQFVATGGSGSYTWSASSLPAWVTFTSAGMLSGTPPAGVAAATFPVTVGDADGQTRTANFTLPVNASFAIVTSSPLPAATVGLAYSAQFTASGGSGNYSWSGSSLPSWLSVSSSGVLSGTPPSAATVTFTVTATDFSFERSVSKSFTLTSNAALTMTTVSPLPSATVGVAYTAQFAASGGSGSYSWSGSSLPAWITVSLGGFLSGTPPSAGTVTFTVTAADTQLQQSVSKNFSLTSNAALTITTASPLPAATVGVAYTAQFAASGGSGSYSWSGSSLPAWITVSSGGFLLGTPPSAGTVTFTVTATDMQLQQSVSKNFSLTSNAALTITTASPLPTATVGLSYTAQFAAAGGSGIYTWSGASLPAWLSISSSGLLSGTPPSAATVTFSVTATDTQSQSVTKSFTLTSNSALTITTSSPLPAATFGVAYSAQFAAAGGSGIYTWSGASLPTWLSISSSGLLSGTPPSAGPISFTVNVADSANNRTSSTFTLPVNAMVTINTTSPLTAGTVGASYSQQFSASGGSGVYTWNGSNLPAWLTLSSAGLLSGTPPAAGAVTFVATVTDSLQQSARGTFSFTVNSAVTINTVSPLAPATVGSGYSVQFTASGGTMIYNWTAANLPTGFALSSGGLLTGTPAVAGPLSFGIVVTDSLNNFASGTFSLPVNGVLTISNTSPLPSAVVNGVYTLQFRASGGTGSYIWSSGALPSWLSLSATGFLTGVSPSAGSVTFTAAVTDSQGHTAVGSFTLAVSSPVTILTTSPLPPATANFSYSYQLNAGGGSGVYLWSARGLPLGLSLTSYGLLFGAPATGGNAVITVTVQDANNTANGAMQTFTLPVNFPAPPAITTTSPLGPGTVNVPYFQQFSGVGGSGIYVWNASGLPAGFGFTSAGLLSGTPAAAGTYSFNVTLVDSQTAQAVTQGFTLAVSTALTITTVSPLPTALVGQAYSAQLSAAGGAAPYTWTGSGLPAGLSLSGSGLVSGTPTATGLINFSATVTDIGGRRAVRAFAIQVNALLTITTVSPLPSGMVNTPYAATLNATGGVGAYIWSGTGLPAWASISASGVVSGTPPQPGAFTINATVTDTTMATASKQFTVLVASGTPLSFVSTSLTPCVVAASCGTTLTATGGTPPYMFTLAGAPSGGVVTVTPNGQLSGIFPSAGTFTVPVQLTDAAQGSVTRTLTVQVVLPLVVTAPATVTITSGTSFTLTPSASQGAPPYIYSISAGMLPPGLALSNTGVISGTPTATGTFTFTIQVTDGTGTVVQTVVTVVVNAATLSIMTAGTLPSGTAGTAYSQGFQAANGNGTLTWLLSGGNLPPGLSLSPGGVLAGTPTQAGDFGFTLQVTDSSGASTTQTFQVHISAPAQLPAVTASLSATVTAGDQPMVTITLGSPYPLPILVTATLQLTPNPGTNTDLLFANGSRMTQFTIPANATQATLPFQAGTLAGTIQIGFTLQSAGVDVTPNPAPSVTTQIAAAAPLLKSVSAALINGGFQLTIVGVSTTRDMKSIAIHFTAASGSTLQSTDASLDVSSAFAQWYQNPASLATGSQFSLTLPITVGGDVASIASVTVVMTNSVGASSSASVAIR